MTRLIGRFSTLAISVGLLGTLGCAIAAPALANIDTTEKLAKAEIEETTAPQAFLYGESQEPDQLGKGYIVFEKTGNQVIGAFYQPRSSFDCFAGTVEQNRLALNVTETYTNEVFDYTLALDPSAPIASTGTVGALPLSIQGFQVLPELSANDQRILSTCKAAALNQ
jgi:hypothetical protein